MRGVISEAERFSNGGTYLNFDGHEEGDPAGLVQAAFGDDLGGGPWTGGKFESVGVIVDL